MMHFNQSFNMIIGTTNEDLDWFNNPYISVKVYELDESFTVKESEDVRLKKCSKKDLIKFMSDGVAEYYPNSLCFEDLSKFSLLNNWFNEKFRNIFVAIEAC
jgi:hypothetical protein